MTNFWFNLIAALPNMDTALFELDHVQVIQSESSFLRQPRSPIRCELVRIPRPYHLKAVSGENVNKALSGFLEPAGTS